MNTVKHNNDFKTITVETILSMVGYNDVFLRLTRNTNRSPSIFTYKQNKREKIPEEIMKVPVVEFSVYYSSNPIPSGFDKETKTLTLLEGQKTAVINAVAIS